jgi:hypothetical protein
MPREPTVTVKLPVRVVEAYQHAPAGQRRTAAGLALADAVVLAKVSAAVVKRAKVDEPIGFTLSAKSLEGKVA